ncbi:MAG TPA: hypothetical protein VHE99_02740 [Gammaproteobacteria bacterium]|nr:hypothetical protein [Gammaproteobacteria bacterium]
MLQIDLHFKTPSDKEDLIKECIGIAQHNQINWTAAHAEKFDIWFNAHNEIFQFGKTEDLVQALVNFVEKGISPQAVAISYEELKNAKKLKHIHRLGQIFEPAEKQIAAIVPGVNNLSDQLLPLDHHWHEQQQRWQRTKSGRLVHLKPKGELKETKVLAFGNPDDPSMLYWRDERQLGHRYRGTKSEHKATHTVKAKRTDGGKFGNTTYNESGIELSPNGKPSPGPYKVKGMVDGHGIQHSDNQINLDPSYNQLPADQHEENMYWENRVFGLWVRQKYFEHHVRKNSDKGDWLCQINEFKNYDQPTQVETHEGNGYAPSHVVVADYVHISASVEQRKRFFRFNNSRDAEYRLETRQNGDYRISPQDWKAWITKESPHNNSLGGATARAHADANEVPFDEKFPRAQIINTDLPGFDSEFKFRHTIPNYQSPPSTPYYLSAARQEEILAGNPDKHFEGQQLETGAHRTSFIGSINEHSPTECKITKISISHSPLWNRRHGDQINLPNSDIEEDKKSRDPGYIDQSQVETPVKDKKTGEAKSRLSGSPTALISSSEISLPNPLLPDLENFINPFADYPITPDTKSRITPAQSPTQQLVENSLLDLMPVEDTTADKNTDDKKVLGKPTLPRIGSSDVDKNSSNKIIEETILQMLSMAISEPLPPDVSPLQQDDDETAPLPPRPPQESPSLVARLAASFLSSSSANMNNNSSPPSNNSQATSVAQNVLQSIPLPAITIDAKEQKRSSSGKTEPPLPGPFGRFFYPAPRGRKKQTRASTMREDKVHIAQTTPTGLTSISSTITQLKNTETASEEVSSSDSQAILPSINT